ncbi:MAG: amylo-alpha-1,6-glucosidase [Phycisphaerae bacterium]
MHRRADDLRDSGRALATEWLLADGAGGYASSTVLFCPTRRYHGLWVPAVRPPLGRHVVLSHVDERLVTADGEAWLSTTEYPDGFHPDGSPVALEFHDVPRGGSPGPPREEWREKGSAAGLRTRRAGTVMLVSRADGVTVARTVRLLPDAPGVCVTYEVQADGEWTLDLAPMLALRSMHHLGHKHDRFRVEPLQDASGWRVLTEGLPGVFLWVDVPEGCHSEERRSRDEESRRASCHSDRPATERERGAEESRRDDTAKHQRPRRDASVAPLPQHDSQGDVSAETGGEPTWYEGVLVRVERERGFDFTQDLLAPGRWTVRGRGECRFRLCCSFDPPANVPSAMASSPPRERRDTSIRPAALESAARAFLVHRRIAGKDLRTVIAGYPWFADWGRDAMIALPGLAVEADRPAEAAMVLEAFASAAADGLIPNRFGEEDGEPAYNTVDASLWYLQALAAYVQWSGEQETPHDPGWADRVRKRLWPVACDIVRRYAEGTRFGIRAGADGLILAGSEDTQLTWMDARTSDGRPVTPRHGKAVEIQALWLSGLALMEEMAEALGTEPPEACGRRADARDAFEALFWNEDAGCLYDCIGPDGSPDASIRPNQVFAVGLPHAPLRGERAKAVVHTVRERLLTPRGLRTLDPADPAYKGVYRGGPDERDAAYHQGTAWPWLLGPYVDAVFAVECRECARGEAAQIFQGLVDAMDEAGLGQISEVYDGDPPHRPGGCIAQAWSVAAAIHIRRRLEETGGVP